VDKQAINHLQQKEEKQLTLLLATLHLALKNIQLYPPGHTLVKERLAVAHRSLNNVLTEKRSILFGVARDTITYEEQPLGKDSPACTAFATILSRHEIASLNFSYGITQHSLFLFLKSVGVLPEQNSSGDTLQKKLATLNIPHIDIEILNYDYLDRTGDSRSNANDGKTSPITWLSFTQKLTQGILGYSGSNTETDAANQTSAPKALAASINQYARQHPEILQQFSGLLDQMLQQPAKNSPAESSFSGRELSKILASLNPALRKQFLNTTLERCDKNMAHTNPEKILSTFSDSVVLEMLQQVNKKEVNVSPALLNLINKLSTIRFTAAPATQASIARQKKISNLLDPDDYAKHVGPEYDRSLRHLSGMAHSSQAPPGFPLEDHLATLELEFLNTKIVQAILILMDQATDEKEYKDLAAKLMEICLLLPDGRAFKVLQSVSNTLKRQAKEKANPRSRVIATQCLQKFTTPDFLNYLYSLFSELEQKEQQDAIDFMALFCPGILEQLLQIFCMTPNIPANDPLIALFKVFRLETLTLVFTFIPKTSVIKVQRLLTLVEYLGLQGTVRLLHPMLSHEDENIRLQVLGLLIPMNDEEAIATLLSMLESTSENTVNTAIEICSIHRPAACTSSLLNLLEYQFVQQKAIDRNRKLFLILSQIGDTRAIPCLEKIAFSKWPFHREQLMLMKRILFYSLKGYPHKARIELVQRGLQSKDEEIHKICKQLSSPRQTKS